MAKPDKYPDKLTIEDARIIFRNFSGAESKFNAEGDRNFCVLLPADLAKVLKRDGWNVKLLQAREEGDEEQAYMKVAVSYKTRPPKIVLISETNRGRTFLTEATVEILDWADIKEIDMMINPYVWEVNDKTGIKAYLSKMFITLEEDELERKYALDAADDHEPEDL